MVEKKKATESYEDFADRLIREAEARGEFANLPGFGKPIPGIGSPDNENWWIRDKLRRERQNFLPPILQVKLEIEKEMEDLASLSSEMEVRELVRKLNEQIRQAQFAHIEGPPAVAFPLDVEKVLEQWRSSRVAE